MTSVTAHNAWAERLPPCLYKAQAVRELDIVTMARLGVTGFELMRQAGRAAFRQARRHWPGARRWLVLCGGGKNGGDGYILATQAALHGIAVECVALADPGGLQGDARQACAEARQQGVSIRRLDEVQAEPALAQADLVVDAMLGTGLSGAVRDPYATVIGFVNRCGKPVLAVDMPSGLCSDTGSLLGETVRAALTVTFVGLKIGLFTGQGPAVAGAVVFESLGATAEPTGADRQGPAEAQPATAPSARRLDWRRARAAWPRRGAAAHKGDLGRLLVIGGDEGMGGAALLASEAAARSGTGLTFLATRPEHVAASLVRRPEVMARAVRHRSELVPLLAAMDAVVLGPGLGQRAWGEQMYQAVTEHFQGALLLDADALNLLAASPRPLSARTVLTPHPGEAARLLGWSTGEVQADRLAALAALTRKYRCTVLLKGAGTLIASHDEADLPTLVHAGNAGMASGGMGDTLSGFIGSLLAQGCAAREAAALGATLHGAAADQAAARLSMAGLLAGDLPSAAARLLAGAEQAGQMEAPAYG